MKTFLKSIPGLAGVWHSARHLPRYLRYLRDYRAFQQLRTKTDMPTAWADRMPMLDDRTPGTPFDHHYLYHTAWAARVLAQTRPPQHTDISSALFFVSVLSAFVPVRFFDYRPADVRLTDFSTDRADLLNLPFTDRSVSSLSCMHVVEHVGLGRYGDPLDPAGDRKAMAELQRVLAPGGDLLFVTPVGRPRLCFNAHRIYDPRQIVAAFSELTLREFFLIQDAGREPPHVTNPPLDQAIEQSYACGCFWFQRTR